MLAAKVWQAIVLSPTLIPEVSLMLMFVHFFCHQHWSIYKSRWPLLPDQPAMHSDICRQSSCKLCGWWPDARPATPAMCYVSPTLTHNFHPADGDTVVWCSRRVGWGGDFHHGDTHIIIRILKKMRIKNMLFLGLKANVVFYCFTHLCTGWSWWLTDYWTL